MVVATVAVITHVAAVMVAVIMRAAAGIVAVTMRIAVIVAGITHIAAGIGEGMSAVRISVAGMSAARTSAVAARRTSGEFPRSCFRRPQREGRGHGQRVELACSESHVAQRGRDAQSCRSRAAGGRRGDGGLVLRSGKGMVATQQRRVRMGRAAVLAVRLL